MTNLIVLRHSDWLAVRPLFSEDAVVRILDLDTEVLPMHLEDVPVRLFQWPAPANLYRVGVHEPAQEAFRKAITEAGLKLPEPAELTAGLLVPENDITGWPGALTPHLCSHCGDQELRMSGVRTTIDQVSLYNKSIQGVMRWESCENHGIHIFINSKKIFALECLKCCEHYLIGPATDNKMMQVREEI